jgi:hypothetical protein
MEEEEVLSNESEQGSSSSDSPLPSEGSSGEDNQADTVYAVEVVNWNDYSVALSNVQQMQVYQSGMLICICVVMVIFMGLVAGLELTRWWRARQ